MVQQRQPAAGQFVKGFLDQTRRALRPRVKIGPSQSAREGGVFGQAQISAGGQGFFDLIHRPFGPRLGIAAHGGGGKTVKLGVIGGMHGDQLALQMGRQLGDLHAVGRSYAL